MRQIVVIGGMGAGKSSAVDAMVEAGAKVIDLDEVGHAVLRMDCVKQDIADIFGLDVFDSNGNIIRSEVAKKAFESEESTRLLNSVTMPRIEELYHEQIDKLKEEDCDFVVVEYSTFRSKDLSLVSDADIIVAILAPEDIRVARAVASGFDEADVRNRMKRQISDLERAEAADVVFNNTSSKQKLHDDVAQWFKGL